MACKISRFKFNWEYLGIVKNELDKRKVDKRVEIKEAFQKIWKELDQDINELYRLNDKENIKMNWNERI